MNNEKAVMALAVMGAVLMLMGSTPIIGNFAELIGGFAGVVPGGVGTAISTGLVVDGFVVAAALAPATGGLSLADWQSRGSKFFPLSFFITIVSGK